MPSEDFELVTLRNGHRAVRHKGHDEVMHPSVGPWAEANLLYVEQAKLSERFRTGACCLYDVGLGAATNAIAALRCWKTEGSLHPLVLHSFEVELEPLRLALADEAGFSFLVPFREELRALLAFRRCDRENLRWTLHLGDAQTTLRAVTDRADVVFHDPFSPASNEPLWTPEFFRAEAERSDDGATLFTYSASTRTRVSLLLGGWFVGVGAPVGTKQETTVAARRRDGLERPLDKRWLERWTRSSARAPYGSELTAELEEQIRLHPQFR